MKFKIKSNDVFVILTGKNTIIQTRGQLTLSKCISLSRCRDNANSRTSGSSGPMMGKARSSSTSMMVSSSEMLVLINISKTCKDSKGNLSEINNLNLSMTRPSRNKCSLPLKLWHSRINRGSHRWVRSQFDMQLGPDMPNRFDPRAF